MFARRSECHFLLCILHTVAFTVVVYLRRLSSSRRPGRRRRRCGYFHWRRSRTRSCARRAALPLLSRRRSASCRGMSVTRSPRQRVEPPSSPRTLPSQQANRSRGVSFYVLLIETVCELRSCALVHWYVTHTVKRRRMQFISISIL